MGVHMSKLVLLALLASVLFVPAAPSAPATNVVVSQIFGGGGNAGAPFRNDYVELFNGGSSTVDVSGWTVQYATAAGTSWQTTALSGTIPSGAHYLVQLASASDTGAVLPTPDATGTSNLAATSGKIALVRGASALTCGATAGSCAADALVEDLAGYGDATDFEGAGSAPSLSNTTAALRGDGGCSDTGDNAADFTAGTPTPRSSAAASQPCTSTPPPGGGSVGIALDVASVLSISVERSSISFGTVAAGERPAPQAEHISVSSNNATGYALKAARTAFTPADLPLALSATAPAGADLAPGLAGGAFAAIPVAPVAALTIGTKTAPSAAGGDTWASNIGFTSALPLVATGRYTATITFTATAR
jgi:Lamin Tail Domain